MNNFKKKNPALDNEKAVFKATRRGTLLGMLGLASYSLTAQGMGKTADVPHSQKNCTGRDIGLDEYLDQFTQPMPQPVNAKEGLAKVGSAKLWYRDTGGTGDTVILVHPTNLSGHCWAYQERDFSEAGLRVISYSRRGYKGSDTGVSSDTSDAVEDLAALIDYLKIDSCHIVSAAGGGAIGAGYAARFADDKRLKSLIVACSMAMFEKSLDGDGSFIIPESFRNFQCAPKHVVGLGASFSAINKDGAEAWRKMSAEAAGDNKLDMRKLQGFGAISSLKGFNKIKVPTLYVAGSADVLCTPVMMQNYAKNTPKSSFGIINGAGHTAFWEAPKKFNSMVLDYIKAR